MDMKKIGTFLARLRKDRGWTQEQLGEKLGVTNKTVSRWENGNYLPPVEMLQALSGLYGITINEILSGEHLCAEEFREKAEENIKNVLDASPFSLQEKTAYFKEKWKRDHIAGCVTARVLIWMLLAVGLLTHELLWVIAYSVASVVFYVVARNRMMIYVEAHAFDGSGRQ